jgi:imidazolonepropionase-like amidohydrolase/enterochelin esterase-like enzyme
MRFSGVAVSLSVLLAVSGAGVPARALGQRPGTVVGTLRLDTLESRAFGNRRLLRVLLPAEYYDPQSRQRRYPVLYLNDGQNLFDSATAVFSPAEWRVDEAVDSLARLGAVEPLIIVGVDNAGRSGRAHELLPFPDKFLSPPDSAPQGALYPAFLVDEVLPFIERRYRAVPDAARRGLGGSSYGALAALYAASVRPGVFGRLLLESPSFYVADRQIERVVGRRRWPAERLYLGVGTNEVGGECGDTSAAQVEAVDGVRRMARLLGSRGVGANSLRVVIESCAGHSEAAWAGRFPDALRYLYPGERTRDSGVVAVRAGRLLDPRTGSLTTRAIILVRDGVVIDVGPHVRIPAGARVVDATSYTVLPGLIDAHVHLTLAGRPRDNARKTLQAGFTTVADLGSAGGGGVRLRDLIGDSIPGPRIVAAGSWIGGRGGVCEFGGATIRGAAEAEARAQADLLGGADLLKVCVTGWLDPSVQYPDSVELTGEELAAVARAGAKAEVPLVAHAIGRAGVDASLAAGVRLFAHTPVVDEAGAVRIAQSRACVATTLTTLLQGKEAAALRESFARLRRAGVRFMLGTDAGVLAHGTNTAELRTLVSIGLTPLEAIAAATHQAAECLGLPHYGALEPGSPGDLIGIAGNPLDDPALLGAPALVIRGGREVR